MSFWGKIFCYCLCHYKDDTHKVGCCDCRPKYIPPVTEIEVCPCYCHAGGSRCVSYISRHLCDKCRSNVYMEQSAWEQRRFEEKRRLEMILKRGDKIIDKSPMMPYIETCNHSWNYIRNTHLEETRDGKQYEIYHCRICLRHCKIEWEFASEIETLSMRAGIEE